MKAKLIIPTLVVIIIALGTALAYQAIQNRQAWRNQQQFELAIFTTLYQGLNHGETDFAKRRLGILVSLQTDAYQKLYGRETGTKFAPMLEQANAIKAEVAAITK